MEEQSLRIIEETAKLKHISIDKLIERALMTYLMMDELRQAGTGISSTNEYDEVIADIILP